MGRLVSKDERGLLALPIGLGGLGIVDPQTVSDSEFAASEKIKVISPLVTLILQQKLSFSSHIIDAQHIWLSLKLLLPSAKQKRKWLFFCV